MSNETQSVLPALEPRAGLPSPPTSEQKYWYYGSQRAWILFGVLAAAVTTACLVRFAAGSAHLWPFFGVLAVVLVTFGINMVTATRKRRVDLPEHKAMVAAYSPAVYPSVDVFLPSAGEDIEIVANTFKHVSKMEWPGLLTVRVLDDSARDEVKALAGHYGFEYHVRPNRGHLKKAGNLKFGYEQSNSDFIVVFDADFVPRPEFISELLPYFEDDSVGIVQSPQFFDTTMEQNWLERGAGATQETFYRWVQPSRDASGAAICVGTNAIYRRKALDAGGGFAQIGHSEDVHTGVNMLKKGYIGRYVPVNLAKGLCPDNLSGFINQQYRWCAGSMSLLRSREFHKAPLSLRQRLCFWSGFAYYISTALLVFAAPLPMLLMVTLFPQHIHLSNYFLIAPALLVTLFLTPRLFHSKWGPSTMRVQMVYSYAHALAVWHTIKGHTAEWVPTGAAGKGTPLAVKVQRMMTFWIVSTTSALWGGLVAHLASGQLTSYLPAMVFALFAAFIAVPVLLPLRTRAERRERRALRRTARAERRSPSVPVLAHATTIPSQRTTSAAPAPAVV